MRTSAASLTNGAAHRPSYEALHGKGHDDLPPKRSITLTEAELRLMRVLWERGECAVSDLVSAIADATPLAYTSVLTTVRILEKKGYVTHRQIGRAFFYSPLVAYAEASRSEVRHVLQRFFGDSRERLLLSVLGDSSITPEELQRLRAYINEATEKNNGLRPHEGR